MENEWSLARIAFHMVSHRSLNFGWGETTVHWFLRGKGLGIQQRNKCMGCFVQIPKHVLKSKCVGGTSECYLNLTLKNLSFWFPCFRSI